MGRLPRHPGNPPPLAPRARTQEVDLPPDGPPWPAADRCRAPCPHPPPRPRELALGLRADPGRAPQAQPQSERDDDKDLAPNCASGARPAADRPDLDRVPAGPGGGHHRLRLLHRRDRLAPDALRPRVHRARQPADPPQPINGSPRLGVGHPAGPEPRDEPRWSQQPRPVPHPGPGRKVQPIVRRGAALGGDAGHPYPDPGTECQRLRGTGDRDDPGRVPRLDAHLGPAASGSNAPDLWRALQPAATSPCRRPGSTAGRRPDLPPGRSAACSSPRPARRPDPRVPRRRGVIESGFLIPTRSSRGRRHLDRTLRTYAEHYNRGRPHRALGLASPLAEAWVPVPVPVNTRDVRRLDLLGGLIHEYYGAAA